MGGVILLTGAFFEFFPAPAGAWFVGAYFLPLAEGLLRIGLIRAGSRGFSPPARAWAPPWSSNEW